MGKEKTRVERAMDLAIEKPEYIIDHRTISVATSIGRG